MGRLSGLFLYALGYIVILQLGLVAALLYWPEFAENIEQVRDLTASIPALGDLLDQIEEGGMYGYVAGQHFFKGCNTAGSAAAVLFAVGAVAGEAHRGTLEILLARPQSRARVLAERYFAGLAALAIPVLLVSATIPWIAWRVEEFVAYSSVLLGAVHEVLFLSTLYSATFLASTLGSNPIKIAVAALFTTTFGFAIYMVKVVSAFSPFKAADIDDFMRIDATGTLDWPVCASFVAISAVLYAISLRCFQRRVP